MITTTQFRKWARETLAKPAAEEKQPWEMTKEELENIKSDIVGFGEQRGEELGPIEKIRPVESVLKMEEGKLAKLRNKYDITQMPSEDLRNRLKVQKIKVNTLRQKVESITKQAKAKWVTQNRSYVERAKAKYKKLIDAGIIKLYEGDELKGSSSITVKGHRDIIQQALSEGKPVPAEVLAEYPDLAKLAAIPSKKAKRHN